MPRAGFSLLQNNSPSSKSLSPLLAVACRSFQEYLFVIVPFPIKCVLIKTCAVPSLLLPQSINHKIISLFYKHNIFLNYFQVIIHYHLLTRKFRVVAHQPQKKPWLSLPSQITVLTSSGFSSSAFPNSLFTRYSNLSNVKKFIFFKTSWKHLRNVNLCDFLILSQQS